MNKVVVKGYMYYLGFSQGIGLGFKKYGKTSL